MQEIRLLNSAQQMFHHSFSLLQEELLYQIDSYQREKPGPAFCTGLRQKIPEGLESPRSASPHSELREGSLSLSVPSFPVWTIAIITAPISNNPLPG